MKIGIISDTHDNLKKIARAVDILQKHNIEYLLHAGDFCSPFVFKTLASIKNKGTKMYAVFGNNDGDKLTLQKMGKDFCEFKDFSYQLDINGKKIIMMHYPDVAENIYESGKYDLVIFGHTHDIILKGKEKKLLNPGTCSGYMADKASIAVADLSDMNVEILTI